MLKKTAVTWWFVSWLIVFVLKVNPNHVSTIFVNDE